MSRKKEISDEPVKEEVALHWSKKRILIGFIISIALMGVLYFGVSHALHKSMQKIALSEKNVTITPPANVSLPSQKDVNAIIQQAQKQITQLTPNNVASSQSTINVLISNLQKLQSGKESPKDAVCQLVCK
jgi:hypothetical protein